MDTVRIYESSLDRKTTEELLESYKQMKLALANGTMKPRQIVGTGYKNGRAEAERYLADRMARYETIIQIMDEN